MGGIYPALTVIMILICWVNWRLLRRWYSGRKYRCLGYGYWLASVSACLVVIYTWSHPSMVIDITRWVNIAGYFAFVWIIGQAILLLYFPLLFAMRRLFRFSSKVYVPKINNGGTTTRRDFLRRMLYTTPALAFGISTQGVYNVEGTMAVRHFKLSFSGLAEQLRGFKIAQISDTHLGPYFSLEKLDYVIELIRQEQPDMLVITGDLIDDLDLLTPCITRLSEFAASLPYGSYFCWGNHEYFRNINRIREALLASPIKILENSNLLVMVASTPLYIMGVDYPWEKDFAARKNRRHQFIDKAQQGIPKGAYRIMLAHHPDFLFDGFAAQIPLTLSGHTHGGQVNFLGKSLLPLKYDYMRGLYQEDQNYGYVSAGTGQWFPFRLGCPPEISIFALSD